MLHCINKSMLETIRKRKKSQGMSLVTVIFLLVVLAGTAAFILDITALQQQGANLQLLESRAQLAAESALDWEGYRILSGQEECRDTTVPYILDFQEGGLKGLRAEVELQCLSFPTKEVYTIETKGSFGQPGDRLYVSRKILARISYTP